ncbi:MAG: hypothetical protein ACK501_15605 [Planctomycetota bacterium]|jgi:DNA-directed RNA polymerase specialized sigma24 family protein
MHSSEAPVGHLTSLLEDPDVKRRILVQTRKKLRHRGLASQTATELAQDAYQDAMVNILRRQCKYDPSLPGERYVAQCVFNAASDLADALKARRESSSAELDPPDAQSPQSEPNLDQFLEALRFMTNARRQAIAARRILDVLPRNFHGLQAIEKIANNGNLPRYISRLIRWRSLQDFRAAFRAVENMHYMNRIVL